MPPAAVVTTPDAAANIYPPFCHDASPTLPQWCPLRIADVHKLRDVEMMVPGMLSFMIYSAYKGSNSWKRIQSRSQQIMAAIIKTTCNITAFQRLHYAYDEIPARYTDILIIYRSLWQFKTVPSLPLQQSSGQMGQNSRHRRRDGRVCRQEGLHHR